MKNKLSGKHCVVFTSVDAVAEVFCDAGYAEVEFVSSSSPDIVTISSSSSTPPSSLYLTYPDPSDSSSSPPPSYEAVMGSYLVSFVTQLIWFIFIFFFFQINPIGPLREPWRGAFPDLLDVSVFFCMF